MCTQVFRKLQRAVEGTIIVIGRVGSCRSWNVFSGLNVLEGMLTRDRERVHMEDVKV